MRIGYLECFAGISGDMLMGALVDAGAPMDVLKRTAASLALGAHLRVSRVSRSGIESTKIDVLVNGQVHEPAADTGPVQQPGAHRDVHEQGHHHAHEAAVGAQAREHTPDHTHEHDHTHSHNHEPGHSHSHESGHSHSHDPRHEHGRSLPQIRSLLQRADLTPGARTLSLEAFRLLAQAEGRIHGVPEEEVHFHEVGALDAIIDIACCAAAVDALALGAWYCSAVNVGSGFVNCAHGRFPVPAPATAELLKGIPTYAAHAQMELVTPTGAALLRALNCHFESPGVMRTQSIGYGAGTRNPEKFPNVVRVSLGETADSPKLHYDKITVLECAVDDASPQVLAHTAQLALEHGALDVMSAAVTMKKGRLGTLLTVLCQAGDAAALQQLMFRETTTLGIRVREEDRVILSRAFTAVETEFGLIQIKTGAWQEDHRNATPEYEDCRRAAAAFQVPLKRVMQAAMAAWLSQPQQPRVALGAGARS